jgi:hypothetical protein
MAAESTTGERKLVPKTETSDVPEASDVPMSAEGVPYQTSGYPDVGEDNPGPFEEGEGRNSHLLKANQPQ